MHLRSIQTHAQEMSKKSGVVQHVGHGFNNTRKLSMLLSPKLTETLRVNDLYLLWVTSLQVNNHIPKVLQLPLKGMVWYLDLELLYASACSLILKYYIAKFYTWAKYCRILSELSQYNVCVCVCVLILFKRATSSIQNTNNISSSKIIQWVHKVNKQLKESTPNMITCANSK